jgi:ketosteroid isomerase-like protein
MSQENVRRVRRALEAISAPDYETALALVHPEIEFVPPGDQAPLKGAESFRRWMVPEAFSEQIIRPLDVVDAGPGKVLGRHHITARGAGSGIELEITSWSVWTFDEDGLITRVEVYLPHEEAEARQAAGLSD